MALNSSGQISLRGSTSGESIALELGRSATADVSLTETDVRSLAGVSSGTVTMPGDFYGASQADVLIDEMLICAGGGGGGSRSGGGGGGGGARIITNIALNFDTQYNFTFGAGGSANSNGSYTSAFGYTAVSYTHLTLPTICSV